MGWAARTNKCDRTTPLQKPRSRAAQRDERFRGLSVAQILVATLGIPIGKTLPPPYRARFNPEIRSKSEVVRETPTE